MKKSVYRPGSEERRVFVEQFALATVALHLADALKQSGITQRELASRLGLTESRISQVLAADSNLTVKTLARVADALERELKIEFTTECRMPTAREADDDEPGGAPVAHVQVSQRRWLNVVAEFVPHDSATDIYEGEELCAA